MAPPAPAVERDLRPRSALEVADVAVSAVRRWFGDLAAVSLLICVPAIVIAWSAAAVSTLVGVIAAIVVGVVALALAHAACVDVVGEGWLGGTPSWRDAATRTFRRAPRLLALWAVGLVSVAVGLLLLVVPGLGLALGFVPAVPVMVLERAGPMTALRRARALSVERLGSHLATLLVLLVLVAVVVAIAVQPVLGAAVVTGRRDAPWFMAVAAAQLAVAVMVVPLVAAATTAAFLDARVRKEGLDLLYLLDLVDEPPAAAERAS